MQDDHARIVTLLVIIRRLGHAVFAAGIANFDAPLKFLMSPDNLSFTESLFLHLKTPLVDILLLLR